MITESTRYIVDIGRFRAFSPVYFLAEVYEPCFKESTHGVDAIRYSYVLCTKCAISLILSLPVAIIYMG